MRPLLLLLALLLPIVAAPTPSRAGDCTMHDHAAVQVVPVGGDVYVNGYYRKDGTYVQPHYRSAPDGNPYNNYSYPGNLNPYTGRVAPGSPDTYLRNNDNGGYYRRRYQ